MMSNVVRIHESQVEKANQGDFDLIATVGAGEADDVVKGREVKPDKRLPPFVSSDSPGTDMTPKMLLIEVEQPDDPDVIRSLKDRLDLYQPYRDPKRQVSGFDLVPSACQEGSASPIVAMIDVRDRNDHSVKVHPFPCECVSLDDGIQYADELIAKVRQVTQEGELIFR